MDAINILLPAEVDVMLRYPRGRALKLAKAGKLPFITLPDGQIRFLEDQINGLLQPLAKAQALPEVTCGK